MIDYNLFPENPKLAIGTLIGILVWLGVLIYALIKEGWGE